MNQIRILYMGISNSKFTKVNLSAYLFSFFFLLHTGQSARAQSWNTTGSMTDERFDHTITLLASGKVLVTGGSGSSGSLSSCELYDSASGTWSATGSMTIDRYSHTATLLPNGKVLVAGGFSGGAELKSCEIYDPSTGAWSLVKPMASKRAIHTATLLSNGKVLVIGGILNGDPLNRCELYDPATNTWKATGSLADGRYYHTANELLNGTLLVTGGIDTFDISSSCELYNISTGTWGVADPMSIERYYHTSTLLLNGKVLITGGDGINIHSMSSCEIFDPSTGFWSNTDTMKTGRFYHRANILTNGKVLVTGGYSNAAVFNSCEIYDTLTGTWRTIDSMAGMRYFHNSTLLTNGKVLVTGGLDNNGILNSCELFTVTCPAPTVSISQINQPAFCQGAYITLKADVNENVTYLWNNAATTSTIKVFKTGSYSVVVTNTNNCKGSDTVTLTIDPANMLSAYTILVTKEVEIDKSSAVKSGGVGATLKKGEIEVNGNSSITGTGAFAKAKTIKIGAGSNVTNSYSGNPSTVSFPTFYSNPYCNSNCSKNNNKKDVKVKKGHSVVLTDSVYNKIKIESNANVTFTSSVIYANEIETSNNDTVNFNGCTRIYLCDELKIKEHNIFNSSNKSVVIYANDEVEIQKGTKFNGSIYTNDKIESKGDKKSQNSLTGLFIAEKIEAKYTDFSWSTECSTCGSMLKRTAVTENTTGDGLRDASIDYLNVYPNPTQSVTTVFVNAEAEGTLKIDIFNMNGLQLLTTEKTDFTGLAEIPLDLSEFPTGMYFIRVVYSDKVKVFKVQKFN